MKEGRIETTAHPVSDVLHRILLMALQGNGPVMQNPKIINAFGQTNLFSFPQRVR